MKYLLIVLGTMVYLAAVFASVMLAFPAAAQELSPVSELTPTDVRAITCDPGGHLDRPMLFFHTDGHWGKATGARLWFDLIGKEVVLGYAFDKQSHVGGIGYGTNRLMFVLHIYDNVTKERVSRLFVDFQIPMVFLAAPEPATEIYRDWNCTHD